MCECGCVANDTHYRFPGPGKDFYVLTLSPACTSCDSPPGITIERVKPGTFGSSWFRDKDNHDGPLKFEKWAHGRLCAGVVVGFQKHEFVKAVESHLVGIDSKELGEGGKVDKAGADVIAEEMYDDATFKPRLVV